MQLAGIVSMLDIDVFVLMYHVVSDRSLPHIAHLYPYKTSAEFEMDMRYLKERCTVLSLRDFERGIAHRLRGRPCVLLTFDDGLAECYRVVRPILLRLGIPCTFLITTEFIDNRRLFYRHKVSLSIDRIRALGCSPVVVDQFTRWIKALRYADEPVIDAVCEIVGVAPEAFLREARPYMTAEQLRQLVADGFSLGGHGRTHVELAELREPGLIEEEVAESCERICQLAGRPHVPFAFPFSGRGVDRGLLSEIAARHTCVSRYFDTDGLAIDVPMVVNRISADAPSPTNLDRSSLPDLLRRSIVEEAPNRANRRSASHVQSHQSRSRVP